MKTLIVLASALVLSAPLLGGEAHVRSAAPLVAGAVSHLLLPTSTYADGRSGAVSRTRLVVAIVTGFSYPIRAGFSTQDGEVAARSFTIGAFETLTRDSSLADAFRASGAPSTSTAATRPTSSS